MSGSKPHIALSFTRKLLPFADAASTDLPLSQLLRLSLFQISVGMAMVLLLGTLNRVMIVELGVAATIVALMVAIPVLIAPFRAALGFKSDNYRSAIGWKRVPFIWFGSLRFNSIKLGSFESLFFKTFTSSVRFSSKYCCASVLFTQM